MNPQAGAIESFVADITKAVEAFSDQDPVPKEALNELSNSDPEMFFAAGIQVASTVPPTAGSRYLVLLLARDTSTVVNKRTARKRLSNWLLDPRASSLKEALAVAHSAADARVQLQAALEMALNKALQSQASVSTADRLLRILNVLAVVGSQSCWSSFEVELMAYPDKVVRSTAALLIGRSTRNVAWIARRLLDRDPRVQANAVETLWGLDAADAKAHFLMALKSKNNRVFANAALGLYRLGDSTIIPVLLEATLHPDPLFRVSALWAIGQSQDPRFLPALSHQLKTAEGKVRLALVGAISRIRHSEKSGVTGSALQIDISQAALQPDGKRHLVCAIWSRPAANLGGLKATEFLVSENGVTVEDYQVKLTAPTGSILTSFIAPWSESGGEPLELAVRDGLTQCVAMKRADELWSIDRYTAEPVASSAGDVNPPNESGVPPEAPGAAAQGKTVPAGVLEPDQLRKIIAQDVPRDRAAPNCIAAIIRQCKAICQRPGKRHVFVLLRDTAGLDLKQDNSSALLGSFTKDHAVAFHGIAFGAVGQWPLFRDFCISSTGGSFIETTEAGFVDDLVRAYASLSSKFEISYSLPASGESGVAQLVVKLEVASEHGRGQAEATIEMPSALNATASPIAVESPVA